MSYSHTLINVLFTLSVWWHERFQAYEANVRVPGNILPEGSDKVAPGLQASQKELEMHMRKDSLERGLASRPSPEQLVKEGKLRADEVPEGSAVE